MQACYGCTMKRTRGGAYVVESEEPALYDSKVIDFVDGVTFVDVTRRGRTTQFIGGVRPPAKDHDE